jgi:cytochrome c oxidase subunit 1
MVERFREEAHVGGRRGHSLAAPSEIAAHAVQHDIEEDPRAR